jgi:hypothetical protein
MHRMNIYLVKSLPKIPYVHRVYIHGSKPTLKLEYTHQGWAAGAQSEDSSVRRSLIRVEAVAVAAAAVRQLRRLRKSVCGLVCYGMCVCVRVWVRVLLYV